MHFDFIVQYFKLYNFLHVITYIVLLLYPFSGFIFMLLCCIVCFSVEPEINNYYYYYYYYYS